MTVAEAARVFRLAVDPALYRDIGRAEADAIASRILEADLAYRSIIMTAARAAHHVVVAAEACGDVATADLATERVMRHEKAAWMLQSFLMQ